MMRMMGMLVLMTMVVWVAAATSAPHTTKGDGKCEDVVKYQPSDDINAKPGVDAKGWAVAPADTHPPAIAAEDFQDVQIGLDVPVGGYLKDNTYNYDDSRSDIHLGEIGVSQQGDVHYNDRLISTDEVVDPDCQ